MPLSIGVGSGDFRETSARVQEFHKGYHNSAGQLTADSFTHANPGVVVTTANVSTTLSAVTKRGALSGTVAFTRPDVGNGFHGSPILVGGSTYAAGQKPLGIFLNDALGNPFENQPAVGGNRGAYACGFGCMGLALWETQVQIGASTALTYAAGDLVFASVNGLLTNRIEDAYQYNVASQNNRDFVTVMGVVKVAPDASNTLLVVDLRV